MFSLFFVRFQTRKETVLCYILKESSNCRHFQFGSQMQHNVSFARACTHSDTHTHTKTDYRYSGIKDTLLPGDSLLLVLTLFNITFTCTTYGAVSVLICVSCKRAVCLVKGGNRNTNGDGVEVEVAEHAVQSRSGRTDSLVDPSGQLFDRHFIFGGRAMKRAGQT